MEQQTRPSRSQQNLMTFIDGFIKQHGYGPSYRDIMRALDYKSVSTVAIHINGLIAKGQLRKRDRSARSLEVIGKSTDVQPSTTASADRLDAKLERTFAAAEAIPSKENIAQLVTVVEALAVLGLQKEHSRYLQRLRSLRDSFRVNSSTA